MIFPDAGNPAGGGVQNVSPMPHHTPIPECYWLIPNGWSQSSILGIVNPFVIFSSNQNVTKNPS